MRLNAALNFWPLDLRTHVVSSIKGAERKAYVKAMFEEGREGEIPGDVIQPALQPELRQATGAIHPWLMGGEYLPDRQDNEVEIARITIASSTRDVTCVYACRAKDEIHYKVIDEYERRDVPASPASGVLDMNFESDRYPPEEVRAFFEATSEFYPDLEKLIEQRVEIWLQEQRSELDEDDKEH